MRAVIAPADVRRYQSAVRWIAAHMAQRTRSPVELAACAEMVAALYRVNLLAVLTDVGAKCAELLGVSAA